jgi:hypothetical protein
MILSKPLFIIVWMYQEMMRWLRRLLNVVIVSLGRIFGSSGVNVGAKEYIFDETQPQIQPSMTHMAQMTLSKPLFIIVWMYQEMMRWLSRLLDGVAYVVDL